MANTLLTVALPSGNRIQLNTGTQYVQSGVKVVFTSAGNISAPYAETLANAATAANLVFQIDAAIASGKAGLVSLAGGSATISSISPTTFTDIQDVINVFGSGFEQNNLGTIWLEDVEGGADSNGPSFSVTFISPNQIACSLASLGDNSESASNSYIMYYTSRDGTISNFLYFSAAAGGSSGHGVYTWIPG